MAITTGNTDIPKFSTFQKPLVTFHQLFPNSTTIPMNFSLIEKGILSHNPRKITHLPPHYNSLFQKLSSVDEKITIMITGVSHQLDMIAHLSLRALLLWELAQPVVGIGISING